MLVGLGNPGSQYEQIFGEDNVISMQEFNNELCPCFNVGKYKNLSIGFVQTIDKNYQQQTLLIITDKPQEICDRIYEICFHGATILHGEGSHDHHNKGVVYSVISGADVRKVTLAVREIDQHAFINSIRTDAVSGNFYLRPRD